MSPDSKIALGDLQRQYGELREELHEAIDRVFDSGWFILGKEVEAFEKEFAAYSGSQFGVGVGNGTDALHLALRALGVGPGDEVALPVNTACPTAIAVTSCGATPVFVDVDPITSTLDPVDLESRLTPETRAIIPVHLYGFPADMDRILEIANHRAIPVLEDCAQAHGSRYGDRQVGTMGALAAYSFYPSKNLGAYGDAGMVTTLDPELAHRVQMLRNYGQSRRYHHDVIGFNSRLDEIQAAMLRVKLKHLERWIENRRHLAACYTRGLAGSGVEVPEMPDHGRHTYHLFVIRTDDREGLEAHLAEENIQTLVHYPIPLHEQKAFEDLGYSRGDFPVAEELAPRILSLPLFPELREWEVDRIVNSVRRFHGES